MTSWFGQSGRGLQKLLSKEVEKQLYSKERQRGRMG